MSLAERAWTKVCVHEIVHRFLLAERETRLRHVRPDEMPALVRTRGLENILDNADLDSAAENHTRLRLLCLIRRGLICEIPPDTQWYEVQNLTDNELSEPRIIAHCGLDGWADRNELIRVQEKKPLTQSPSEWKSVFLFDHDQMGPFTIIEGNHRLAAYASSGEKGINIPVYVGLSKMLFFFNSFDEGAGKLVNDLLK